MRFHLLRWIAFGVFVISSTLNYLDRLLLNTLAPLIMLQLHFNQSDFGVLISAFSIVYAATSLIAGWFLDRVGVNRGISVAVSWWSAVGIATGFVRGFGGLIFCRTALGIGESAGVPAVGKLNAIYLKPEERALGAAVNQIGLSLGAPIAALFVGMAVSHGWRMPFVITGLCGLLWIPVWLVVNRAIPPPLAAEELAPNAKHETEFSILRDRSLILLVIANVLWMGGYSLWSNWTTLYLTRVHHLTLQQSARYVWIPPLISNLGGFFGGWMSLRWIRNAMDPVTARRKAVWVSAGGFLITLALPLASSAASATAIISLSFFFALAGSVNIYALPIDIFGAARSALAISALTCAFGILQTVISPVIGFLSDHQLYTEVVWIVTIPAILGALVLTGVREKRPV
ncbi:MAG: MFS transporter [Acidobacteriaceae bacterium]|nr:MFS transporter [Acidobacteriaceae bacterium]MBV9405676.1 MFS transporter [Acidobacteriaceae bacterium]MBV9765369.1 MFS transporter [Acidobacteriaceae bacterium]